MRGRSETIHAENYENYLKVTTFLIRLWKIINEEEQKNIISQNF